MKKKSRMQNNSVINKRNKTPCRDHTQTMDHNNKRNNTMDCHPYIKKKVMRKKTGSTSKRENFLGEWFYLSAMSSILVRRTETVVETWLCKLFLSSFIFFSLIFGWFSSHASRHGRAFAYLYTQSKGKGTRNTRNWWILYLFSSLYSVQHSRAPRKRSSNDILFDLCLYSNEWKPRSI